MKHLYLFIIFLGLSISLQAQSFSGKGTSSQPWQISTAEQLDYFVRNYSGNPGKLKYFVITQNISMESHITSHYGGNGWIPYIGISSFYGYLNGCGYTISGIWKNDTNHMAGGLFSILEAGGRIYDLGIELGKSGIRSKHFTGGLLAVNRGVVSTCFVKGGDVHSGNSSIGVGGLVGMNDPGGIISRSYTGCKVNGGSFIKHPATLTPAMGGFVGLNKGRIEECYSKGKVNGLYGGGSFAGVNQSGTMSRCYFDIDSCGMPQGTGWDENSSAEAIFAVHTPQMKQESTFINWDFNDIWNLFDGCSTPVFQWETEIPGCECAFLGRGTAEKPYQISSAVQLNCLRHLLGPAGKGMHFRLTKNINLEEYIATHHPVEGWLPIGHSYDNDPTFAFHSILLGDGHIISGLWINRPHEKEVGLFGGIGKDGRIENLGVEIKPGSSVKGEDVVGGLTAMHSGTIKSCFVKGDVESVRGEAGELAGISNGSIHTSYSLGTVKGDGFIGGIAGLNMGTINQCYSACTLFGNSSGAIAGFGFGSITSSYYDSQISSGGKGIGKTTPQMQQKTTFTGWDFSQTWQMMEGGTYPLLLWQTCDIPVSLSGPFGVPSLDDLYSYTAATGNTHYIWKVEGGTIHSGQGTPQVKVQWNTNAPLFRISVNYKDKKGCFSYQPTVYDISHCKGPGNISISGPDQIINRTGEYTTQSGYFDYTWKVEGGTIRSGQGTPRITIDWFTADHGIISVNYKENGGCFSYTPTVITVRTIFKGVGIENHPYEIWTAREVDDLRLFTGNVGKNVHFKLMVDIDLSDYIQEHYPHGWESIGGDPYFGNDVFDGLFDGNLHTLFGLYLKEDGSEVGLFGVLGESGWVKNLGVIGHHHKQRYISSSVVGAIAGENRGHIVNCFTIGTVGGSYFVGGICGINTGTIKYCRSDHGDARIDAYSESHQLSGGIAGLNYGNILSSYTTGTMHGNEHVGGIVGSNESEGSVRFCSSTMSLTSYNTAIGGLANSNAGKIEHCYFYGYFTGKYINGLVYHEMDRIRSSYSVYEHHSLLDNSYSEHMVLKDRYTQEYYSSPTSQWGYNILKEQDYNNNYWVSKTYRPYIYTPYLILRWQENFDRCDIPWQAYHEWEVNPYTMDEGYYYDNFQVYLSPLEYWPGRYCDDMYFAAKNRPATLSKEKADTLSPISPLPPVTIIYPNPTTGKVTIEFSEEHLMVKVYNIQGILLKETTEREVDLSPYPAGTYLFHINGKVQKVIKK